MNGYKLESVSYKVRQRAMELIGTFEGPEIVEALLIGVRDSTTKDLALSALSRIGRPAAPKIAAEFMKSSSPELLHLLRSMSWEPETVEERINAAFVERRYKDLANCGIEGIEKLRHLFGRGIDVLKISQILLDHGDSPKDLAGYLGGLSIQFTSQLDRVRPDLCNRKILPELRAVIVDKVKAFVTEDANGKHWPEAFQFLRKIEADSVQIALDSFALLSNDDRAIALIQQKYDERILKAVFSYFLRTSWTSIGKQNLGIKICANCDLIDVATAVDMTETLLNIIESDSSSYYRRDDSRDLLLAVLRGLGPRLPQALLERVASLTHQRRIEKKWIACEMYSDVYLGVDCTDLRQMAKQCLVRRARLAEEKE